MIRTIEEIVEYTSIKSNRLPRLSDRILITTPGYSPELIQKLKEALPNIADNFIETIGDIKLDGISINYFNFSSPNENYIEKLETINSVKNGRWNELTAHHFYQVASFESDLICISNQSGIFRSGEIVIIRDADRNSIPKSLANSFKIFLLAAFNMDEILSINNVEAVGLQQLSESLDALKLSHSQKKEWMSIFAAIE